MEKQTLSLWKYLRRNRIRRSRGNAPPTPAQIILAVTAALMAFIASQLGG